MPGGLITPPPLRVVRVADGRTLFEVALAELGDATQWDRIADLNNLTDPWLTGYVALTIPRPLSNSSTIPLPN